MQEESIEQEAINTYRDNLLFLQETDIRLFRKIESLNLAIEKNYYKEKYSLEYREEAYFDVLELESGKFLYGSDSNEYATRAAAAINFKKKDNLFETFYNINFHEDALVELENLEVIKSSYTAVASIINYANQYADKNTTTMHKLYKFVFVGSGLGTHITAIHKKLQSNIYLVVEDDLELFRLSLFVTNYKKLTLQGSEIVFSIFDEPSEFKNMIQLFLNRHFVYNHYIKFFHMLHHSNKRLKDIQNIIVTQTYLTFNYAALMTSLLRPLEYLKNGYKILNITTTYKDTPMTQKPILLIGAGPSFDNNIQWLQKNHHKFIIVIVSALMSKFEELLIKPDIITHVHGQADAMPHIEKVKDMNFFNETIELFGAMSFPNFTEKFQQKNVFIMEGGSRYKDNFGGITSSNIGSLSLGLLLMFQSKEIYTLGLDFSINQDTGQTHANIHAHTRNIELKINKDVGGEVTVRDEIIEIEGNFQEKVYTSLLFDAMRRECNAIIKTYHTSKNTIYNLSNGAKIDTSISLDPNDKQIQALPSIDKKSLYSDLLASFNSRSEDFLTPLELKDIHLRIEYYNSIIKILEKHLSTPHGSNIDQYHYNLLGTFFNLLTEDDEDKHSSDMNYIITLYLQFVSGYIFDLINTKEITNKKKLIKQLDKEIIPQITKVVTYFRDTMKQYLEELS